MLHHIKRLIWPLLFGLASLFIALYVGISPTNLEVIVFKFMIFCPSVVLVHLARLTIFPYIDLSNLIHQSPVGRDRTAAATIFSVFLFYVVLVYALTQAI